MSRQRKILVTSVVLLVLAAGLGFGSFATFTGRDQPLNLTVKKPGDSGTATLTLKNVGDLNAATFKSPSTADDTFQGRQATMDLDRYIAGSAGKEPSG